MEKKIKALRTINKWAIRIAICMFTVNMFIFSIIGYPTFLSQYKGLLEKEGSALTYKILTMVFIFYIIINAALVFMIFIIYKMSEGKKLTILTVSKILIVTALTFLFMPGLACFESTVNSKLLNLILCPGLPILYGIIYMLLIFMKAYTSIIEKQQHILNQC